MLMEQLFKDFLCFAASCREDSDVLLKEGGYFLNRVTMPVSDVTLFEPAFMQIFTYQSRKTPNKPIELVIKTVYPVDHPPVRTAWYCFMTDDKAARPVAENAHDRLQASIAFYQDIPNQTMVC